MCQKRVSRKPDCESAPGNRPLRLLDQPIEQALCCFLQRGAVIFIGVAEPADAIEHFGRPVFVGKNYKPDDARALEGAANGVAVCRRHCERATFAATLPPVHFSASSSPKR
jgi:hypothetical protein